MIRSLRSLVRYRVEHSKRNPICTCAHYYLSVRLSAKSPRTDTELFVYIFNLQQLPESNLCATVQRHGQKVKEMKRGKCLQEYYGSFYSKKSLTADRPVTCVHESFSKFVETKTDCSLDRSAQPQLSFLRALYSSSSVYTESFITLSVYCQWWIQYPRVATSTVGNNRAEAFEQYYCRGVCNFLCRNFI